MIGFGASFGFTVMARISLFINRLQFIDNNWIQNAFNTAREPNPNWSGWFQAVFWAMMVLFIGYAVKEFVDYRKRIRSQAA